MAAVMVTAGALVVDVLQTRSIRKINHLADEQAEKFKENGTLGEQFLDALMEPADPQKPDGPTNLQVCAHQVGQVIAQSFSAATKGIMSGDIREYRSVERKLMEGLETPETKALMEACDRFGISRELAGVLLNAAAKNGLLPKIIGNNGQQSESKSGLEY